MAQLLRKLKRALFNYDPSFCDMYDDPGSRAAAEEYLTYIRQHLRNRFGDQKLSMLDAGCQAGRLLIPLAEEGHCLIGVDASGFALRRAKQHATQRGLSVTLHEGSIAHLRRWVRPGSLDAVICTEVLYLCRDHRELMRLLMTSVKPGGLLFISHRPTQYYLAAALREGRPADARAVADRSEGPSPEGNYHNWQTLEQLTDLYRSHHAPIVACYPIRQGTVSLDLATMNGQVQRLLESARQDDGTFCIPAYLLVVAERP